MVGAVAVFVEGSVGKQGQLGRAAVAVGSALGIRTGSGEAGIGAAIGQQSVNTAVFTAVNQFAVGGDEDDAARVEACRGGDAVGAKGRVQVADGGIGFVTKSLYDGIKIRAEGRYLHNFFEGGQNDYRLSFGIEIPLGRVIDRIIEVPTPTPAAITEIKEVPRPWVDSDGDGVDDEHDDCPNTPHGLKVDAHGCVIPGQSIELNGVTFDFNRARLTTNAQTILNTITPAFIGQPSLKVEIAGHTDSIGTAAANLKLSQARAEAVRAYLISRGAKPQQLVAKGYGLQVLMLWFLPSRLILLTLGFSFFWLPHVPHDTTQEENFTRATTVRQGFEWFLGPVLQYQNYHLIHHLYPMTPFYNNYKVWQLLEPELRKKDLAIQHDFDIVPVVYPGRAA